MPEIIICFSPRTEINKQNISKNNLNKLDNKYYPINFSEIKNILKFYRKYKNLIITCCAQSSSILYETIKDLTCDNIFVWFDEAHWGIEDTWLDSEKKNKHFWLENKDKIKYRLFTSASPDETIVSNNKKIFGELYSPIKVKELIDQKWLCPVQPYIFETKEKDNINLSNYLINNFTRQNKTFGLSFHNLTNNAFQLFSVHYELYKNEKTDVKPFLIIGKGNTEINDKIKSIKFEYNFLNLEKFMKTKKSIAYTVKMLDMGWDFKELDFICFSDSKLSSKDIIQSIGRGTRPDKLGVNNTNLNKKLSILLPVFIQQLSDKTDYTQIINVLNYLINDVGLNIKETIINKNTKKLSSFIENNNCNYDGSDEIAAKILKLLGYKNSSLKNIYSIMRKNKIHNDENYYTFRNNNKHLQLKEQVYDYEGFKWKQVVDIEGSKYYENYEACLDAKLKLLINKNIRNKFRKYGWKKLNEYDKKIPPYHKLKEYYY